MDNVRTSYQEAFKRQVVAEIEAGRLSQADAAREYGLPKVSVKKWLDEFGRFRPQKNIIEVVMKSEKERIQELEKALAEAHLKIRAYDELIRIAEKEYKLDLKKNIEAKSSGNSAAKGSKSRK